MDSFSTTTPQTATFTNLENARSKLVEYTDSKNIIDMKMYPDLDFNYITVRILVFPYEG